MGIEIKRIMEKDDSGVTRQIYPMTHVSAVEGIDAVGNQEAPVKSVNGKKGEIVLTPQDLGITESGVPIASETQDGILTAEMYRELKELIEHINNGISLEKVEE